MSNLPTVPTSPIHPDLIRDIAMDISKDVAAYVEYMYPNAVAAASSSFLLSVRNCTFNKIMAALAVTDDADIRRRIEEHKIHRRRQRAAWKKIRAGAYYPGMSEEEFIMVRDSNMMESDL